MRLVIRLLGADLLDVATGRDADTPSPVSDRGDCTTYPVGFVASPGDQRWEKGVDA